jgi:hypothetical protein
MNKGNLLKMADYLDNMSGCFVMNSYEYCVLGWSGEAIQGIKQHFYAPAEVHPRARKLFGIMEGSSEWHFCFGARWGIPGTQSDKKAAAARLRYVAQHGAAPSEDQWSRFMVYPMPQITVEDEAEDDVLELVEA